MAVDVMIDIETLHTAPESVVLTVGAYKFDPWHPERELPGAYWRIDVDEQIGMGRLVGDSVIEWWGTQSEEVREEALGEEGRISVMTFVTELNKFLVGTDRVWAQGPVFDIVILENLFRQTGLVPGWVYYNIRDSRTLLKALGDTRAPGALAHNALADCVAQAGAIQTAVSKWELTTL